MRVIGPGAHPAVPVTMHQASNTTGDIWASDIEHSESFMEAVRNGANIGELRRQSAQSMLMQAGTAELSPVIYETVAWCGKDGCRPATPCPSCAGHRKPVIDDSAATEKRHASGALCTARGRTSRITLQRRRHPAGSRIT